MSTISKKIKGFVDYWRLINYLNKNKKLMKKEVQEREKAQGDSNINDSKQETK